MTRPWEETWSFADRGMNPAAGARLYSDNHDEEWATTWGEESRDRAKLAAQAPAMARLLLSDSMWHHAECVACYGHRHQGGHEPDCAIVAVLKAAGIDAG